MMHESHNLSQNEPLYTRNIVTVAEAAVLAVISFTLVSLLTNDQTSFLLELLSFVLPEGSRLPKTKYQLSKYASFDSFTKFYCPEPSCEDLLSPCGTNECECPGC